MLTFEAFYAARSYPLVQGLRQTLASLRAMNLDNSTPIPAKATVSELPGEINRIGILTAKATFKFDRNGQVELDTQNPFPLLSKDQETPLGPLPTDSRARRSDKFEVMLLGNAYPPRRGATAVKVALTVGTERRELLVCGDRVWIGGDPKRASISQARPFDCMPLLYERSFGGTAAVHIDSRSILDISHPINPRGKGFDARPQAEGLCKALRAPQGFPALPPGPRALPNIENPRTPIARWEDAPDPVGWAPAPLDSGIPFLKLITAQSATVARLQQQGRYTPENFQKEVETAHNEDPDLWLYRAHPDWVIDLPQPAAIVRLENLLAGAPAVELRLPQLRVVADYVIYGRQGQRDLRPQSLVLLPEEQRFYLVYRLPFHFEPGPAHERSFRLRTAAGWLQA